MRQRYFKKECNDIQAVKIATGNNPSKVEVIWNNNEGSKGYGGTITLEIRCPVATTTYSTEGTFVGKVSRKRDNPDDYPKYKVVKQSTAKY